MKRGDNISLVLFFVGLTLVVTWIVIFAWEGTLRTPYYHWVDRHFPPQKRWNIQQRGEHFVISTSVDILVVTLLLRIVERQKVRIRRAEERYRAVFENATDGLGLVNSTDGCVVEVNRRFADLLGYRAEDLVGKEIGGLLPPEVLRAHAAQAENGYPREEELTIDTLSGSHRVVSVSSSWLHTDRKKLVILLVRDLSERKKLAAEKEEMQRQLFQKSKLASIGEFSAGVAHEINNPLNAIINFAQLLFDGEGLTDDTDRQMARGIIDEGERISRIVRNLLTFAGRDSREAARVNVGDVVNNSLALFGHQLKSDGIEVQVDIPEDLPAVVGDGLSFRQVVLNMISNARNALNEKAKGEKEFLIRARYVSPRKDGRVEIEFFDNGPGIDPENLDKVFDPFFTTRRESGGTGLGLSLSFGILRELGGTIRVESKQGEFTRFIVNLPAAVSEAVVYGQSPVG